MNKNPLIIVIGAYGSGKSEYAINLAKQLHKHDDWKSPLHHEICKSDSVFLVDLDIVNPYFRSRDVREQFEKEGITVIAPESKYRNADIPMISPMVKGAIMNLDKTVILDVGGDPAGSRALARFADDICKRPYIMQLVVNTKRPFTSNVEEIIIMKEKLEYTSKLKVTELICNTNLMDLTDEKLITEGINIIKEVASKEALIFDKYLVLNDKDNTYPDTIQGVSKINLEYFLMKPWEKATTPTPSLLKGNIGISTTPNHSSKACLATTEEKP